MGSSTEDEHAKLLIFPACRPAAPEETSSGRRPPRDRTWHRLAVFVIELFRCGEAAGWAQSPQESDRVRSVESEHQILALAPLPTFSVESASISTANRATKST